MQILRDTHGAGLHLGERDCSVQRRHQKVVEEAPAPGVGRELRGELGAAALRLAEAVGYVGAGTAEFLLAPDGSWYFLEMNARIQVEHPVTELVTSIDIVRRQLEIAAGRPLELEQGDVLLRGHAIEARIYAEDADHGFLPTSGTVLAVRWPRGPGIRVDAGVDGGDAVGTRYDGLLAKLCVHGETRARALARLRAALDDVVVLGLTTNLPAAARDRGGSGVRARRRRHGLARAHLAAASRRRHGARGAGRRRRVRRGRARREPVAGPLARRRARVRRRRRPWRAPPTARCTCGWTAATSAWSARRSPSPSSTRGGRRAPRAAGVAQISAPMPGAVLRLAVAEGDEVDERDVLLVLEAMKMEHPVWAPFAGRVAHVACREGQQVAAGELLLELDGRSALASPACRTEAATDRLSGLALAGIVVAIFAVGLAAGRTTGTPCS